MQFVQFYAARADTGAVLPYARATVLLTGTTTEAALFDAEGEAIDNPLTADGVGALGFATNDGIYDVEIVSADGTYSAPPIQKLQVVDLSGVVGTITSGRKGAPSWAAAAAMSFTAGELVEVPATDTGTHTDPISGLVVPNTGIFRYKTGSPSGLERIYAVDLGVRDAALLAQAWAESDTAPAGPGTKSAKTLAAEVDAALATVPIGASLVVFSGQAPDNRGQTGDRGYSTDLRIQYPARSADGWEPGIDPSGAIVTKDSVIWDMALGLYPSGSLTTTRAQASTTLTNMDPSGTVPVTVAAGQPVVHPTKGLLCYQFSKALLSTSNPSDTTVTMPVTGRLAVWLSGPGQVATSAGTATGTGWGTHVSAPRTYQLLNITGAGTINLDFTGTTAETYVRVEYNDVISGTAVPTPFVNGASTRNGDQTVVGGDLLTALQAPAGTLLIDIERPHRVAGIANTVLSLNGAAVVYLADDDSGTYYDGTNIQGFDIGDANFSTGPVRIAMTWEAGHVSIGGGSRIPARVAYSLLNGVARTSARLGNANNSDVYGQQSLNGAISRIEFMPAALSDFELFERYNIEHPFPSIDEILVNYDPKRFLRSYRDAVLKMLAGTVMPSGHWPVVAFGPGTSHTAATNGTTGQIKQTSTPARWAAQMTAQGIPARVTSWVGNAGFPGGGGTNTYDNRLSCSAGWSGWGTQLAGSAMRATTAGCWIEYAEPTETDWHRIFFWMGNASAFGGDYGRIAISVNGAASIKTINCSGVAGMGYADVGPADGVVHGVNTYRVTTLDAKPVGVVGSVAWSSVNPHLIVVNGGTPLRTMVTMATDSIGAFTPENSVPELLRKLGASLIVPEGVTNDAAGLVGDTVYRTAIGSVLDAAIATGADVWPWTDPPSATATIAQDVQDRYTRIFLAECAKRNLTVADWHFAMGPHAPYAVAKMGIFHDLVHLTGSGTVPGYEIQARRAAEVTGARLLAN